MALFRRKKTDEPAPLPPEVEDYYQAEKRERSGIAWLLALATLALTILVSAGLFYGGKWAYKKITNPNKPDTGIVQEGTRNQDNNDTPPTPTGSPQTSSTATPPPAPSTPPVANTPPTPPSRPGSNTPAATTQNAANSANLPTTGPADTAVLFGVVVLAGYFSHQYLYASRKTN